MKNLQIVTCSIFVAKSAILLVSVHQDQAGISKMPLSLWDEDKVAFIEMVQSHPWRWNSSMKELHEWNRARESYISVAQKQTPIFALVGSLLTGPSHATDRNKNTQLPFSWWEVY